MNITFSIPNDIVKNAREYAKRQGTSLNQMIRDYLKRFSQDSERQKRADDALAFFQSIFPTLPKNAKITRDEMEQR
jgi:hypothetical protein